MTSTSARSLAAISTAAASETGAPEGTRTSPVFITTTSPTATRPVIDLAKAFSVCPLDFLTTLVL